MKAFKNFDPLIPLCLFVIASLGLATIASLAPDLFFHQLLFLVVGFFLFLVFSRIDIRVFESLAVPLYFASIFFLGLTFLVGQVTRGATRWIQIGGFTVQPSELVKPFLILFATFLLVKEESQKWPRILTVFVLLSIPILLVFKQPDLGSSLVMISSFLGILLASGVALNLLLATFFVVIGFFPLIWHFLADYQQARILTFLNPQLDPLGAGYNLLQAVITVGSGRIFGRGLGRGTQSHLAFLPEYQTDFIFASLSEELGFIGASVLLFFYALLLLRILKVAQSSSSAFGRLICLGVFSMIIFQVFVNVGMNMGIAPITGITLPFVSVGGSSIVSLMICLGLVEAVVSSKKPEDALEIK